MSGQPQLCPKNPRLSLSWRPRGRRNGFDSTRRPLCILSNSPRRLRREPHLSYTILELHTTPQLRGIVVNLRLSFYFISSLSDSKGPRIDSTVCEAAPEEAKAKDLFPSLQSAVSPRHSSLYPRKPRASFVLSYVLLVFHRLRGPPKKHRSLAFLVPQ